MPNDVKPLDSCDVVLLNGPNLNLLGTREPEVYGADTLNSIENRMLVKAQSADLKLELRQTNFEGELVTLIQQIKSVGANINPNICISIFNRFT